jgi:Holliday junction resolvase
MTNRSRDKGTSWETQVVRFLQEHGWVHAERRARRGIRDAGDIAGVSGVMIEAKCEKRIVLAAYLDETQVEQANANAAVGVTWIKRPRKSSPAHGYVVMTGAQFIELLKAAGY